MKLPFGAAKYIGNVKLLNAEEALACAKALSSTEAWCEAFKRPDVIKLLDAKSINDLLFMLRKYSAPLFNAYVVSRPDLDHKKALMIAKKDDTNPVWEKYVTRPGLPLEEALKVLDLRETYTNDSVTEALILRRSDVSLQKAVVFAEKYNAYGALVQRFDFPLDAAIVVAKEHDLFDELIKREELTLIGKLRVAKKFPHRRFLWNIFYKNPNEAAHELRRHFTDFEIISLANDLDDNMFWSFVFANFFTVKELDVTFALNEGLWNAIFGKDFATVDEAISAKTKLKNKSVASAIKARNISPKMLSLLKHFNDGAYLHFLLEREGLDPERLIQFAKTLTSQEGVEKILKYDAVKKFLSK